ncbi:glucose dehydrogenase [FAD, quinone] isoform X2 [Episyrphus balteatus]|nr:glucose dehydrogenase [FAD, quinone] isoform X2 [Episyrphus balteatus]XP_055847608.1 glucose dehydrogenase [FAD, quinone] isoform X2 [Episyrphus balteatus]
MLLLLLFCASCVPYVRTQSLVDLVLDLETTILNTRIPDRKVLHRSYDFIVIGAGSGGAVVASRLSETKNATVLLLEAGDQETFLSDVPLTAPLTQITRYNWGYKSDPVKNACQGLRGGVCNWPKGRGLGGTSLINFMLYTRGHRKDYDNWSQLGNLGWSYEEVLPYFKKSERIGIPELRDSVYHGRNGNLDVQYASYGSKLLKAFLKSSNEMGYNITDPNGEQLLGFSRSQATIRKGRRCSTAKAFIKPAAGRPNLHISMRTWVTKILIDPKTKQAIGVEFIKNKKKQVAYVRKEVILSAGTIASPQLLMLSGIGPAEHLAEFEIPVIQDLKVGYNLQDHVTLNGLVFMTNVTSLSDKSLMNPSDVMNYVLQGKGPYTIPGGAEAFAFVRTESSNYDDDYPDMEIVLGAGSLSGDTMGTMRDLLGITDQFYDSVFSDIVKKTNLNNLLISQNTFGMVPVLLRPKSRGRISLRSRNPFHWPRMQPNFMEHDDDTRAMIEGIKMILQISNTNSMRKVGSQFHKKPFLGCENEPFNSESYWRCCLRLYGSSLQHQSGTCKMGPDFDTEAVVDPQLRVKGIQNLRVVDASIIPIIPAGHTNAIVIMIAEKASDMIKQSWGML